MEKFVQNIYQTFSRSLENTPHLKNLPVRNPGKIVGIVRTAMKSLKSHFSENPFADQASEIHFFKYDKPKFFSEYIYELELFTIESNKPFADERVVNSYYEQELSFIRRFFDQHRFLYQYYLLDGNELDEIYFTSGQRHADLLLPQAPDAEPDFSTPADFIFAKFRALERLQDYLMGLLYPAKMRAPYTGESNSLRWTGDKINLIELAYGIYNTAQVNDGEINIIDIISWLENSFQVKLSRYFQMFSEIKSRKSVSKTRYLDHMSKMIRQHIEQGNAFVPEKPRPVSGSKPAVKE
jgi:hypothetical protein